MTKRSQIVYKYRLPSAWYFTSKQDGTVSAECTASETFCSRPVTPVNPPPRDVAQIKRKFSESLSSDIMGEGLLKGRVRSQLCPLDHTRSSLTTDSSYLCVSPVEFQCAV